MSVASAKMVSSVFMSYGLAASWWTAGSEIPEQPGPLVGPAAVDRGDVDAHRLVRCLNRQPREVAERHQWRLLRLLNGQCRHAVDHRKQPRGRLVHGQTDVRQVDPLPLAAAAALDATP